MGMRAEAAPPSQNSQAKPSSKPSLNMATFPLGSGRCGVASSCACPAQSQGWTHREDYARCRIVAPAGARLLAHPLCAVV